MKELLDHPNFRFVAILVVVVIALMFAGILGETALEREC